MVRKTHQGDLKREFPLLYFLPYVATITTIVVAVECMVA
jgi:hypothetical protein